MLLLLWSDTDSFLKKTFNFGTILDLQKICKDSTVFPNNLHLVSSHGSILYNYDRIVETKRLTLLHSY